MEYDLEYLTRTTGYDARELEKVLRISDLLEDISHVKFLYKRLSLYGGTVLNFIYLRDIPRLSIDLDFNYRHLDDKDWGNVRDEVEHRIKKLLYLKGYAESDLRINPSYPLCRIDVSYVNSLGGNDSFLIEIGYIRRYPILKEESEAEFMHIGKGEHFKIKTPMKEELFANKFVTCLYRTSSRDIYDVYRISEEDFDMDIFRKCVVIESLMHGKPPLHEVDISERISSVSLDSTLRNLLVQGTKVDFNEIRKRVIDLAEKIIKDLTAEELSLIREFYDEKKFKPESIDDSGIFHSDLSKNPAIKWSLKNL